MCAAPPILPSAPESERIRTDLLLSPTRALVHGSSPTLNEHLSWSPHTANIAAKAHTLLSFLERNLRNVPQELRLRAYFTIPRPAFEYACEITDP